MADTDMQREIDALKAENARLMTGIRDVIPLHILRNNDTPGALGPTGALDLVGAVRELTETGRKCQDRLRAIRDYVSYESLDLKSCAEIQLDLLALVNASKESGHG